MTRTIHVDSVIETNNCAGKKYFKVTALEDKHHVKSQFRLTPVYMMPHDKLFLASVAPSDELEVVMDHHQGDLMVIGEFVTKRSPHLHHEALCRCKTALVSDGFDVYCPNQNCPLTLAARLERLDQTIFFRSETLPLDLQCGFLDAHGVGIFDDIKYCRPFHGISNPRVWGLGHQNLTSLLFDQRFGDISLATFLVPSLFEELTQELRGMDRYVYQNILRFYGEMDELVNRRDTESQKQQLLINGFLWSLGIESLHEEQIVRMASYARHIDDSLDPITVYAYILTHSTEMTQELGFHRLEALSILSEVHRRNHELFDIFAYYANSGLDVANCFANMR